MELAIRTGDARRPAVAALVAQLDQHLQALYPDEANPWLPLEALCAPAVTFLVAERGGDLLGCGAFVDVDGAYADVKRLFIVPRARRRGVATRLLAALEERARGRGLRLARLETGVRQPDALALFERAGYRRRAVYGAYLDVPISVFMEKAIVPGG